MTDTNGSSIVDQHLNLLKLLFRPHLYFFLILLTGCLSQLLLTYLTLFMQMLFPNFDMVYISAFNVELEAVQAVFLYKIMGIPLYHSWVFSHPLIRLGIHTRKSPPLHLNLLPEDFSVDIEDNASQQINFFPFPFSKF